MAQPSSVAGESAERHPAPPRGAAAPTRPRALPRVQALIDAGRDRRAARDTSWWEQALEALRSLLRPPVLRHAIAALRRGNLDAAFALLREEVKERPGRVESALLFWNVALSCERASEAADAMAKLVRSEAGTDQTLAEAANHWAALVGAVPEAVVEASALVKLLPLLRARSEQARGEAAKLEAYGLWTDTLRRCADPSHGALNPALALRLVEEARGVDADVARRAAEIALQSSGLHEARRARLQELLAALERGEWPVAQAAVATPTRVEAPAAPRPVAPVRAATAVPAPVARAASPARKAVARPAAPAPSRPRRPRAAAPIEESAEPPPSGRRTVALTQDEIEAASSRLAERMAARRAPPAAPAEAPQAAPLPEPRAQEKDEPIAILEQDDALSILEADGETPILEVDAEDEPLARPESIGAEVASAVLEADGPATGDEPEAILEDTNPDFEFGGAAAGAASYPDEPEDAILDGGDAGTDFEFGSDPGEELTEPRLEPGAAADDDSTDEDFALGESLEAELEESALDAEPALEAEPELLPEPALEAELAVDDAPPALRAIDILPVEIGEDGMVAYEVAQAQRTRIDYRAIEAIAAAEVTGLADDPILVVELVLRPRAGRPRSALRMRCDTFDAATLFPDRTDAGQAVRAMLSDLLERTRAVPLPDPDSALAIQPQRYESLGAFEAAIVERLPA
jgi:hypothetical protein